MSPQTWRQHWVNEKCDVAIRLSEKEAGGGYAEAAIITCAVLSALSAELWAGSRIDKSRFVEMLVQFGSQANRCRTISVPLLVQHLNNTSRESDALKIQRVFSLPDSARVLTGPDIDKTEQEVLSICPQLDLKTEVRRFSYAALLYQEIRSSYAHEYKPGKQADSWPMTMLLGQQVSYINRMTDGFGMQRLVHFHIKWITQLAVELASVVDQLVGPFPLPVPKLWWIEGG